MGTGIVGMVLIIIITIIIIKLVKDNQKGKSIICGGDCSGCGGACHLNQSTPKK